VNRSWQRKSRAPSRDIDHPSRSEWRRGARADAGEDAINPCSRFNFNGPDKIRTCDLVLIRSSRKPAEKLRNRRIFQHFMKVRSIRNPSYSVTFFRTESRYSKHEPVIKRYEKSGPNTHRAKLVTLHWRQPCDQINRSFAKWPGITHPTQNSRDLGAATLSGLWRV
jgi:hypothetical protein